MTITVVSATNNYHNVLWESTAPADGVWVSLPWPNIVLPDHAIGENVPNMPDLLQMVPKPTADCAVSKAKCTRSLAKSN